MYTRPAVSGDLWEDRAGMIELREPARRRVGQYLVSRAIARRLVAAFGALVLLLAVAACAAAAPAAPKARGGTYTSADFHFSITYPDGWQAQQVNGDQPSTIIPLTVVITRIGAVQTQGPRVSTLTITVFNARDPNVQRGIAALQARARATPPTLKALTLAGKPAFQTSPDTRQQPGLGGVTHTDYFLIAGDYEYQLATDDVAGDNADGQLQAMLQSFALS
jgi:hypothetical protein